MRRRTPRIVALLPSLSDHGGIQRHNRMLCRAVEEWVEARRGELVVVSLRDPPGWFDERYLRRPVVGCAGNRYRFAWEAVRAMRRPHDVLLVGVVDFGSLLVARRRSASVWTVTHGIEVWGRLTAGQRAALHLADRVLTVSAYTANQLVERHAVQRERIDVVPIPLDPGFLEAVEQGANRPRPSTVLSVARINRVDAEKGIDRVLRVLPGVLDRVPGLRYVVVGDGDDRPRLEALVRDLRLSHVVTFVGAVDDTEMQEYLAGTELFVLPSRKEGFGIVFLEAMAHGKVVVAGGHGGSPEVVRDGETGLLVDATDAGALEAALADLLMDSQRRATMGAAGRARVRRHHAYESFRAEILAVLDILRPADRAPSPTTAAAAS